MYRKTKKEKLAIELSWDHKPTRPEEKERSINYIFKNIKYIYILSLYYY